MLGERSGRLRELVAVIEGRADPVRVAQAWLATDWDRLLGWVLGWALDLLRLRVGAARADQLSNADQHAVLQGLAQRVDSQVVFALVDDVLDKIEYWFGQDS